MIKSILFILIVVFSSVAYSQSNKAKKTHEAVLSGEFEKYLSLIKDLEGKNEEISLIHFLQFEYYFSEKSPSYNLDSAYFHLNLALNHLQNESEKLKNSYSEDFGFNVNSVQSSLELIYEKAYKIAANHRSISSFKHFISYYDDNKFKLLSISQLDTLQFEYYKSFNSIDSLYYFKNNFQGSKLQIQTINLIVDLKIKACVRSKNISCYEAILKEFPNTEKTKFIDSMIYELKFDYIQKSKNIEATENFLKEFPSGARFNQANSLLNDLYYFKLKNTLDYSLFKKYCELFPEAQIRIVELTNLLDKAYFNNARKLNTKELWDEFIFLFPNSQDLEYARKALKMISFATKVSAWIQTKKPFYTQYLKSQNSNKTYGYKFNSIDESMGDNGFFYGDELEKIKYSNVLFYINSIVSSDDQFIIEAANSKGEFLFYVNLLAAFELNEIDTIPIFLKNEAINLTNVYFMCERESLFKRNENGQKTIANIEQIDDLLYAYYCNYDFYNTFQKQDLIQFYKTEFLKLINDLDFKKKLCEYVYSPEFDVEISQYDENYLGYFLKFKEVYNYWPISDFHTNKKLQYFDNTGFYQTIISHNGAPIDRKSFDGDTFLFVPMDTEEAKRLEKTIDNERLITVKLILERNESSDLLVFDGAKFNVAKCKYSTEDMNFRLDEIYHYQNCKTNCCAINYSINDIQIIFNNNNYSTLFSNEVSPNSSVQTRLFKNYVSNSIGSANIDNGSISYEYILYRIENGYEFEIKNELMFNNLKAELLTIVNTKLKNQFTTLMKEPDAKNCIDDFVWHRLEFNELGITFSDSGIIFIYMLPVYNGCQALSEISISIDFQTIQKYLK